MKHFLLLLIVLFAGVIAHAQMNVGSSQAPDSSAMLQISGKTKGFLPPRMTRDTMLLISNPAKGLIVFNTSDSMLYLHRDTGWVALSAGEQQWFKSGNNIYNINSGNIGIGTASPATKLHIVGANPLTLNGVVAGTSTSADSLLTITNGLVRKIPVSTFGSGSGSVTSVSVSNANGLNGSVSNAATTPSITLSTTVSGMIKGNGTALSAATTGTDYAPGTAGNTTGIVKSTTGTGALTTAVAADFPILNQNTTGTASNITGVLNATSFPALTGDVTTSSGSVATTIANGVVTNSKLATMPANTFKANNTGSTATPANITGTQATAMLDAFTSATKGLVPASGGGTTTFLRADGTFAPITSANGGTVTSVSVTNANGVSGTVTNASTTPAISLTLGAITPTSVTASGDISTTGTVYIDNGSANTGAKLPGLVFGGNTSGEGISSKRTTGGSGFGLDFYTNNLNRMAITQAGNVGIGTSSPAYKLHIVSTSDPLYLAGVNTGTSTSADSLLTITSGVVRKLPISTFATPASSWSLTGNSGTTTGTNFLGTTDNKSLTFRTNNTQRMLLDENGNAAIGTSPTFASNPEKLLVDAGTTSSFNVISGKGNINNYLQLNIQNTNAGTAASSDVVASADNGNESTNYIDMGINSSGNTANYFGGANDAYLYNVGQNLLIGTATESKSVVFLTGGGGTQSTNERMRIDSRGNVGIGIASPSYKLHVAGTNPLALSGVQTGTSADSILTISGGVVKMLASSGLNTASTAWSLFGNSNTSGDGRFLGTTNTDPLIIKVNSQPTGRLDTSNTYLGYQSGYSNGNNANKNIGIGNHALFSNTSGTYNTALGYGALQNNVSGGNNIGIGNNAAVFNNSSNSIAIGTNSNVNNSGAIAIGNTAQTNNTNAISLGNNTYTNGNYGISIGSGSGTPKTQAYADYSMAIGYNAYAGGTSAISIGSGTNSGAANAISIGNGAAASFANSVAIGYNAAAQTENTIVLGDKSNANVSVAIGPESFSTGNREKLLVDAGTSTSYNVISARGSLNNYLQLNVQNRNGGGNASSDLVATADNGDESNNYVDLGINSSGNTSNYFGGPNDAYLYTLANNMLIGTANPNKSVVFLTGGGTQSNNERMRIDGSGNVGIGTISPSTKLHIVGTNPLTLTGVQTGTSTSADSLLTITSGLVKKIPIATFTSSNSWSTTGNSGTSAASNFLGTTDFKSLKFRTNNTQRLLVDSLGNVAIGTNPTFAANAEKLLVDAGSTNSYNVISGKGNINNYLQLNIQNTNAGTSASSDVVSTADNGTETTGFIDMGINSSGNTSTGAIGGAGTAYLYSTGNDLAIGNGTANKSVLFFTGGLSEGDYTERFRLDASGRVGIGTKTPTSDLSIYQSSGTGGSRGVTLTGNSIGNTNSGNGFLLTLGYNAPGNKQLWLGDPDYAGNASGSFVRYISSGGYAYLDGINGDNSVRKPIAIGYGPDAASGVVLGSDENATHPGSYIWGNGNMTIGNGYRANAAPSNGLLVQGNVGIATTSPTSTLSVGGSVSLPVSKNTGAYTLSATDHVVFNTGGAVTWTLPDPTTCTGRVYRLVNHGTANVTLSRNVTIANGSVVTTISSTAGSNSLEVISDGSIWRKIN